MVALDYNVRKGSKKQYFVNSLIETSLLSLTENKPLHKENDGGRGTNSTK